MRSKDKQGWRMCICKTTPVKHLLLDLDMFGSMLLSVDLRSVSSADVLLIRRLCWPQWVAPPPNCKAGQLSVHSFPVKGSDTHINRYYSMQLSQDCRPINACRTTDLQVVTEDRDSWRGFEVCWWGSTPLPSFVFNLSSSPVLP